MKRTFTSILTATCLSLLLGFQTTAHAASKVVYLQVDGMTTPTCPTLLKSAVKDIKGVKHVEANLEKKSATIVYDESLISLEKIQNRIKSAVGFTTKVK